MVKKDLLTQCKAIPVFRYSLLSLLFLFLFSHDARSQAIACNDRVNISVDANCTLPVELYKFQEGVFPIVNQRIRFRPNNGTLYLQSLTLVSGQLSLGPNPVNFTPLSDVLSAGVVKLLIGKVHTFEVYNTATTNKCWGTFLLEDKLAPTITCQSSITVECADGVPYLNSNIKSTSILRRPTVSDNCGFNDSTLVIEDRRQNCGGFIARHWSYTDCGGIKGTCSDTIRMTPLSLDRRMCPNPLVSLKCSDGITPDQIYDVVYARPIPSGAGLATALDTLIYRDTTALKAAYPFFKTLGRATFDAAGLLKKTGKLDAVCGFITTSSDQTIYPCGNTCGANRKIIRTWIVLDWCNSVSPTFMCPQVIEATNPDGPTIKANDLTVSVDPWACAANFTFPAPEILHDVCDPNPTYTVRGPVGVIIRWDASSGRWMAIGAPKGTHIFTYVAKDCCGKVEGTDEITVSVFDKTPPVAVAKQNIIISLTTAGENEGSAKLFANSVDNGSYDSCTPVFLELRRDEDPTRDNDGCDYTGNKTYNADGHPNDGSKDPASPSYDPDNGLFVKFCCDDITNREGLVPFGIVKVWMRVWDDGNSSGFIGDTINGHTDNYNETWINVRVEDKLTPKLVCPSDVTINCDSDASNLSLTGRARAYSNCVDLSVDYRDQDGSNSCGAGTINRTWFIRGNPSIQCVQKIVKRSPTGTFGLDNIKWPADATTNCVDDIANVKPTWVSGTCDLIGLSLKSDTFYFESGACLKILNRYTVINWCTYNPNYTGASPLGIWYKTQVIKIVDNDRPSLGSCEPKTYEVNSSTCDVTDLVITQTADDLGQCNTGSLKWIVFVDLWGDGTTDLEYSSFLPLNDTNLGNDTNGNGINDRYVAPTSKGSTVSVTIPEIIGGASSHKVTWKVVDGCGNITTCTQNFSVADKKKPSPYCLSLSSALMKNGQVELWAVDFNVGSSDNCTSKSNLLYTFDEANPVLTKINQSHYFKGAGIEATLAEYNAGNAQKWIPSTKSSGKIFGCSSLPSVDVKMTVWDEKLNFEFCMVKLSLLDNQGACGPVQATTVSGRMVSNNGQSVKNAEVVLDNGVPELLKSTVTNASGDYTFNNATMHYDYTIAGKKTDDYLNGVSTLDLVMIQRHILGLDKLDGPYNLVAADANVDEKVTASDLTELRKLILGIYAQLPKSDSWKFIDKTQSFTDANNPWPLEEKIKIKDLSQAATSQNFVAVKVGDVNSSATGNIDNQETDTRSKAELYTENKSAVANELQSVVFDADLDQVYGMQFTLTLNNADLVDVYVGGQKISESNIAKLTDNKYTVSWNDVKSVSGNEILTLNIVSKVSGNISDLISVNSSVTSAEVYSGDDLQTSKLSLRFGGKDNVSEFTLYQNEPNPFNDKTIISFNLPEAGNATLKVFDVTGQVIYKNKGSFGKGINNFTLTRDDLPSKGVMIYQIESGANVGTKKMIGLE